jgi:radical SAM superfamily enzyme YgiQ (UPF0313 family)
MDEKVFPSLGVLRVAHAADCDVLDLAGVRDYESVAREHAGHDLIGLSATTPQMPAAMNIARAIRAENPKVRLCIGGPHVTMCYTESPRALRHREQMETAFDVVVAGDGEIAIREAMAGRNGVIRADRRIDPGFLGDGNRDTAREKIDIRSYRYEIDGHRATSVIAQLGCPFHCGFCGGRNSHAFRVIRKRSVESVIGEIRALYETYGFTGFMFYDDELNVNPGLMDLLSRLRGLQDALGVEMRFRGFVKAELFNEPMAHAMHAAGFRWILCGFEGAHPTILRNIRKRATVEDNTRVIEYADRAGLKVKALMSVGHPAESEMTVRAVERWLIANRPADFDCTVITPYPGTPYYDESVFDGAKWTYRIDGDALHSSDLDYAETANFYKGMPGQYQSYVWTDFLAAHELTRLRDDVEATVRTRLAIPGPRVEHEHSMGMSA